MESTPIFKGPLPEESDPPDGAAQISAAVEWVEELLAEIEKLILEAPAPGQIIIVNGTSDPVYKSVTGDIGLTTGGVTSIGAGKVLEAMLGGESVATAKIKALAVTAAKLAENAVTTAKIEGLAVTEAKIAALAVSAAKLANEAVETGKIKNLAVTEAKIAAGAVTEAKIADGAVTSRKMKPAVEEFRQTGVASFALPVTEAFTLIPGLKYEVTPAVASKLIVDVTYFATLGSVASFIYFNLFKNGEGSYPEHEEPFITGYEHTLPVHLQFVIPLAAELNVIEAKARYEALQGHIVKRGTNMVTRLVAA